MLRGSACPDWSVRGWCSGRRARAQRLGHDKREQPRSVSPATRLQRSREICVTANRLSGGRMGASLLAAAEAATALVTSQWEPAPFPLRRLRLPSGSFANPTGKSHSELSAGEWDFQIAARKASGRTGGAPRGGEGGGSRGDAALAVSHSAARVGGSPLPCARHFLWGTFLSIATAAPPFPPFSAHR